MTPVDDQRFNGFMREIFRTLVVTMNDVAALKILVLAHVPNGREHLGMALEAAERETKPFLDALDQAADQELLDMLSTWKDKGGTKH